MKKLLMLSLTVVMVLSLVACSQDDNPGSSTTTATTTQPTAVSEMPDPNDENPPSQDEVSILGTVDDQRYTNTYIGLGYTLPADWTSRSEDDLKFMNGLNSDMTLEEVAQALKDADTVYDIVGFSPDRQSGVFVVLQKTDAPQMDSITICNLLTQIGDELISNFSEMEYTGITYKVTVVQLDDVSYNALEVNADYDGVPMQMSIIAKRCDGHLALICVELAGDLQMSDMLSAFFRL